MVTGLSARGFAVVLNAVVSEERYRLTGWPVLLFLRRVLQRAEDFDQAVKMIAERTLFMSGLITVVGTENHQRVCIERTPTQAVLRWAQDDVPLISTNAFVSDRLRPALRRRSGGARCASHRARTRHSGLPALRPGSRPSHP